MTDTLNNTLDVKVIVGSIEPIEIQFVGQDSTQEDFANAMEATFAWANAIGDANEELFRTADSNLEIQQANGKLIARPTQTQADAFKTGVFIADTAVRFGASQWKQGKRFRVNVLASQAPRTA